MTMTTNPSWKESPPPPIELVLAPFKRFSNMAASSGLVLAACAAIAIAWANSPLAASYFALWNQPLSLSLGGFALSKPLLLWINDGLMAVFFFHVGLEIKREILAGELNEPSQAALPVAAALGGMLVPGLIYAALNHDLPTRDGWGVPMATDIAFALGILSLLGKRVPVALKVFLAAVAIVDDIGAVLIIAVFYTADIALEFLLLGAGAFGCMLLLNALGCRRSLPYLLFGLILWLAFLKSGVHATVAGVLAAMAIPARARIASGEFLAKAAPLLGALERAARPGTSVLADKGQLAALEELEDLCSKAETPLQRIEHALQPWAAFVVMPVFALANAGVSLNADSFGVLAEPEILGIVLGLFLGKQAGVFLACLLLLKTGLAKIGEGLSPRHYYGASLLAGVGFTMSIFIAGLAFDEASPAYANAKIGVTLGSLAAGLAGYAFLRLFCDKAPETSPPQPS